MNQYYETIMNLPAADDFKHLVQKWNTLSDRLKQTPLSTPSILPDMLWIVDPGSGITKKLTLLSEYIAAQGNLMDFYGDVKFFEFLMNYCPPDTPCTEIPRLMNEVRNAAGFRSEYRGMIRIHIDEWIGHCEEEHFTSLLEYLASNSDNWLIIFTISSFKASDSSTLEAILSMYLRIEKLTLRLPDVQSLFEYAEDILASFGSTLNEQAKSLLVDSIEILKRGKYFDGYKTIKLLCHDIVYDSFSNSQNSDTLLTEQTLSAFSVGSPYLERAIIKTERIYPIGFSVRG